MVGSYARFTLLSLELRPYCFRFELVRASLPQLLTLDTERADLLKYVGITGREWTTWAQLLDVWAAVVAVAEVVKAASTFISLESTGQGDWPSDNLMGYEL